MDVHAEAEDEAVRHGQPDEIGGNRLVLAVALVGEYRQQDLGGAEPLEALLDGGQRDPLVEDVVSHLSESVFNKFEELYADANGDGYKMPFSLQDTVYVMIRAMRSVQLELAETKMDDAKAQLEKARALTFTPRKVTKEDEERALQSSVRHKITS